MFHFVTVIVERIPAKIRAYNEKWFVQLILSFILIHFCNRTLVKGGSEGAVQLAFRSNFFADKQADWVSLPGKGAGRRRETQDLAKLFYRAGPNSGNRYLRAPKLLKIYMVYLLINGMEIAALNSGILY